MLYSEQKDRWTRYVIVILGCWLIFTPLTFTSQSRTLYWNDILCGILLVTFGFYALNTRHTWAPWVCAAIGVWLQFAPLLFWAPDALTYLNETLVGSLVIIFSILIPGVTVQNQTFGNPIPEGWSYNPSSWPQRAPIIALGFVCWFSSRYMASYQLGYLNHIWDPVFDNGTLKVITSSVSKAFPISDAGLGALAYTIETLTGFKGGIKRWYTMPWAVIFFGVLVIPVGLTSIILIMLQPILVGYWCFWCLLTAFCMLAMIALTVDEVAATLQFLSQSTKSGNSFWKTFWKGGEPLLNERDASIITYGCLDKCLSMVKGVGLPWNLALSALIGITLLFSKSFLSFGDETTAPYILGALITTISIISVAEVIRSFRYLNMGLGLCLIASTWFLKEFTPLSLALTCGMGIALILLCIPRGKINETYGSLNHWIL
ncbi:putative uncharacterized protein [Parachlamydia acanthamoebae UV-7]|uniref:Uncharacterized protein n=2 Tax=Parachlamydia acanthamoebae TaxID=83552 RepID=F8L1X1_PARAV|nr:vitamin K epoxide reductase family protein [Parachlamydia acanthamoebae]CCB87285.1 putative uncharacterized protein [Parachlamydia acanthamoebae UV-7]